MAVIEGAITYANLLTLLALGLTLTYITTSVPNFAQGSFAVFSSYIAYFIYKFFKISPYLATPFAIIFGGFIGVITYLFVLKPLIKKEASILILMIATLAWDLMLLGFIGVFSESFSKVIGAYVSKFIFPYYVDFSLFGIQGIFFSSTLAILLSLAILIFLLYKTKFGIAMRASMENPSLAQIMGVNVEKTRLFSWFLSGAFSGLAGALLPFKQEIVQATGQIIIVSIFAASIVGGLAYLHGAILGGYLIGLSESLVTFYLSKFFGTSILVYSKAVSLVILVIVLLFVPEGLVTVNWRRYLWRSSH